MKKQLNYKAICLLICQSLTVCNDSMFKLLVLVHLTYASTHINVSDTIWVTLASLSVAVPYILFSSYAGKIIQQFNSLKILKLVKISELCIITLAFFMFKSHNIFLLGLLFLMGTHAVFLYPVKYTILFNYMEDRNKAITYLHINLILSATIGNILASIIISLAKNQYVLLDVLLIMSCVGIFFAYLLPPVVFQVKEKISYSINPLYDMLLTYKKIRYADSSIVKIITKISANWMFCIMFITQLPVITKNYLHGDSSVFSLLLCAFIIAIAIGMVLTSRIVVNKAKSLSMITLYKFIMVAFSIAFMCSNFNQGLSHLGFVTFISNYYSLASIIWIMLIGFYSGVYAVYLYNQLLQRASDTLYNLSTSLIAGLSTLFIIIISLLFIFGLKFISIWYIMLIFIIFFTIL